SGNSSVQEIPKTQQFTEEREESASDGFFSGLKKKSLENLGSNLFGKAGVLAIILGFVWFLDYAFTNQLLGPSSRIYIGLISSFVLFAGSLHLMKKGSLPLGSAVAGSAFSVLYLSVFSAWFYYDLLSLEETFLSLCVISALPAVLAYISGLQLIYIFSFAASVLSPILLSTGENSYRFFFTYLMLVNLGFLFISRKYIWRFSAFLVYAVNIILYSVWAAKNMEQSSFLVPALFLYSLLCIFLCRESLFQPLLENDSGRKYTVFLLSAFTLSIMYCIISLADHHYPSAKSHFILGAALLYLFSAGITLKKEISLLQPMILLVLSLLGAFTAVSLYFEGNYRTLSFAGFAGGISASAGILGSSLLLYVSIPFWIFTVLKLMGSDFFIHSSGYFLLNTRFLLFLAGAALAFLTYRKGRNSLGQWILFFPVTAVFCLVWGSFADVHEFIQDRSVRNLGYSYVLAAYSVPFLAYGFYRNSEVLRKAGLFLLSLLVLKLYMYDIWKMSITVRILAGFSLGGGLLLLSVFYERLKDRFLK
ncbi:MAG TPA: DUF2339 domain-containing protein, partial [Leptospiraceae bacterium]|nr:DUF2339 domain-containing protein [Leptospiraceae bacterium]